MTEWTSFGPTRGVKWRRFHDFADVCGARLCVTGWRSHVFGDRDIEAWLEYWDGRQTRSSQKISHPNVAVARAYLERLVRRMARRGFLKEGEAR